jgi:ketosteroid isomerase-like protein
MVHDEWAFACVRDLVAAWNRRDWSALDSIYARNVVYESPHSPPVMGVDAMRHWGEDLVAMVPDLHDSGLRMIGNDSACGWATFEFVQTGTLHKTLPPPDTTARSEGAPFAVRTTMFVRFDDDGRVAKLRTAHA